ncbi:hypothetical protein SCAR479_07385 [Seiridium cardinale]|uniref:Uncharacterized protein n=1 Tax=Seiridium cardinale TaxID=138064 RepID=A0ABR2XPY5_9PEZI
MAPILSKWTIGQIWQDGYEPESQRTTPWVNNNEQDGWVDALTGKQHGHTFLRARILVNILDGRGNIMRYLYVMAEGVPESLLVSQYIQEYIFNEYKWNILKEDVKITLRESKYEQERLPLADLKRDKFKDILKTATDLKFFPEITIILNWLDIELLGAAMTATMPDVRVMRIFRIDQSGLEIRNLQNHATCTPNAGEGADLSTPAQD